MKNGKNIFTFMLVWLIAILFSFMSCTAGITEETSTPIYYTVTFDTQGGSNISLQTVEKGKTVIEPDAPTKSGYSFIGWYNNSILFDFTSPINGNITLTAKWLEIEIYTISFNSNAEDAIGETQSVSIKANETVSLPTNGFSRNGYVFIGWSKSSTGEKVYDNESEITVSGSMTLYAVWKSIPVNYFEVSFDTNGGTSIQSQIIKDGEKASEPNIPTKKGYNFSGWYFNDIEFDFTTPIFKSITLTAKWVAIAYTIIYDGIENATNPNTITKFTTEDETITLVNAIKTGYTFDGWYNGDERISQILPGTIGDIILTAKWIPNTYIITFLPNGAEGNEIQQTFTYDISQSLIQCPFERTGYLFGGWALSANGEKIYRNKEYISLDSDISLYAKWIMQLEDFVSVKISNSKQIYVCIHEVTQDEYVSIIGVNPSIFRESPANETIGKHPVENISWTESLIYCNKRSLQEGFTPYYIVNGSKNPNNWGDAPGSYSNAWNVDCDDSADGYRLLTQSEWLFIANEGYSTDYLYSGNNDINESGWYSDNSKSTPHQVCLKTANSFGIYDLTGNVRELIYDFSGSYSLINTSTQYAMVENRSALGGSFSSSDEKCKLDSNKDLLQNSVPQGKKSSDLGFRVCRTIE